MIAPLERAAQARNEVRDLRVVADDVVDVVFGRHDPRRRRATSG
jgi:hypothetical protein